MLETILFVILSTLLFGTVRYFLWFKKHNIPGLWFFFLFSFIQFSLLQGPRGYPIIYNTIEMMGNRVGNSNIFSSIFFPPSSYLKKRKGDKSTC